MSTSYRQARGANSCQVDGCQRPFRCSGYCGMHYNRVRQGKPAGPADGWTPETATQDRTCAKCLRQLPHTSFARTALRCKECLLARKARRAEPYSKHCTDCSKPIGIPTTALPPLPTDACPVCLERTLRLRHMTCST
jgi:hypothetical protein